jgi:Zn-dependent M16 (insulinase) family peptidase
VSLPKSNFIELEHVATGARYVHLANDSVDNVFAVVLKTVPDDSSGVAHILEHSVLNGSEKYPIRDPFFSMLKRSLQTFMNAFTASDWTAYPFASPNKKDFYNLMSVYLDAVFFPKLDRLTFCQEGWRHSLNGEELRYEGVVYNEMKGSMSSADRRLEEAINSALYANAPYHYNTGGDPAHIPGLSYENLIAFHKKFYHPSNAFFYSNGSLPLSENLKMINDNVLYRFERSSRAEIRPEEKMREPQSVRAYYPIDKLEPNKGDCQIVLSWLVSPVTDNLEVFTLELLEDLLFGNSAAPMRKALLDSGLGSDLSDVCGYDSEALDTRFAIGMRDVREDDMLKVEALILSELERLATEGIDKELIKAVIKSNETRKRHVSNSPYPVGLQTFLDIVAPWIHGADVLEVLAFEELLATIKEKVEVGGYFESCIRRYLLENTHRVRTELVPDEKMQAELERAEADALREKLSQLDSGGKENIIKESEAMSSIQEAQEDLSCLPVLSLDDIAKQVETSPEGEGSSERQKYYEKETNRLLYFGGASSLDSLEESLRDYITLFSYLLPRLGTKKRSYEELAKLIDSYSGGLVLSPRSSSPLLSTKDKNHLLWQTFSLESDFAFMLGLIKEMIKETDLSDISRIQKLLGALYADYRSSVVEQGHSYAAMQALAPLSPSNQANERWHGLCQLDFLGQLKKDMENGGNLTGKGLSLVSDFLRDTLMSDISVIGEKNAMAQCHQELDGLLGKKNMADDKLFVVNNVRVAFTTATAVSFSAAAKKVPNILHGDAPAILVAAKILGRTFLHREIREKRGAYGAYARYDYLEGNWTFSSYRDPHIISSLEAYARARDFIMRGAISDAEVKEAIIAVSGDIERPETASEQGRKAFARHLIGLDDEQRRRFREGLLAVKREDLARVGDSHLHEDWRDYSVALVSAEEKMCTVNKKLGTDGFELKKLP